MNQNVNSKLSHFIDDAIAFEVEVSCENFELQINEALDRRESPRNHARLMEHAADCSDCEQILHEYVSVDDSLKLLKGEIEEILARGPAQPQRRSRFKTIAAVGTAALLLLISLRFIPGPSINSNVAFLSPPVSDPLLEDVVEHLVKSHAELDGSVKPMGDAVSISAQSVEFPSNRSMTPFEMELRASLAREMAALNMSIDEAAWEAFFADNFDQLAPMIRYSSVIPGVRPMQGTVNMTLEFIRRAFATPSDAGPRVRDVDPDLGRLFLRRGMLSAA